MWTRHEVRSVYGRGSVDRGWVPVGSWVDCLVPNPRVHQGTGGPGEPFPFSTLSLGTGGWSTGEEGTDGATWILPRRRPVYVPGPVRTGGVRSKRVNSGLVFVGRSVSRTVYRPKVGSGPLLGSPDGTGDGTVWAGQSSSKVSTLTEGTPSKVG